MIHTQLVDDLFEKSRELGASPPSFAIFDKRVLLPLDELDAAIQSESSGMTFVAVAHEVVQRYQEAELFPVLPSRDLSSGQGIPLYVPSRIALLNELEQAGWTLSELRAVVELEEMTIDCVLAADDLAYSDDDEAVACRALQEQILSDEELLSKAPAAFDGDAVRQRLHDARRLLSLIERGTLGERSLAKLAYRIRARDEGIRLLMMEMDRSVLRAGISPWIRFRRTHWSREAGFSFEGIDWRATVRQPMSGDEDTTLPLRLPGVMLADGQLTLTGAVTPAVYAKCWRELDLEAYFRERAEIRSERICQHCLGELPPSARATRLYCSETCRSAAKMQRFRENSPDKNVAIQARYWTDGMSDEP